MKKLFFALSIVVLCAGIEAMAQSPLSVSAMGYVGGSGDRTPGVSLQLKANYHFNRFSVGTGINYFHSGSEKDYSDLYPISPFPNMHEEYRYRHLMLPLTLSYHAPMGRRFEFIPSIGLGASYTTKARFSTQSSDSSFYRRDLSAWEFERNYRKVNLWGIASLHLACNLNEQLALLGGFEVQGMITNMFKPEGDGYRQRQATLYAGLGIRYRF